MKTVIWLGLLGILITSCLRNGDARKSNDTGNKGTGNSYATGFEIVDGGDYKLLKVFDPWQNSRDVTFSYVLAPHHSSVPDSLHGIPFMRTPVHRVIALSTTHVAMVHELGMAETIKGISGTGFIYNREVRERIRAGEVVDVGYDQGLNYESIVALAPDVVFIYGVEGSARGAAEKLDELGVSVVFCGEYLESHPLGKTEWIRFFSLFYDLDSEADLLFSRIESAYKALTDITNQVKSGPVVLTGLPWKDTWYIAGGQSYAARMIKDAGGRYLWEDDPSSEVLPMDLESVFARAMDADIWINPGAARSLEELRRFDDRLMELPVLSQGRVFNNDARTSETGGNDYWESGTIRADLVLADLINIFHPDLLTDHRHIYYRKLK